MASLTGGLAVFPSNMKELDRMYSRISEEIHSQYTLGYVSTNAAKDGKWRRVDVRLKRPAASRPQVRTRQGYFAASR